MSGKEVNRFSPKFKKNNLSQISISQHDGHKSRNSRTNRSNISCITDQSITMAKKISDNLSDINAQNKIRWKKGQKRTGIEAAFAKRNGLQESGSPLNKSISG